MTAIAVEREHDVEQTYVPARRIPTSRVISVELRKMFDTRVGLLADGEHRHRCRRCDDSRHPVRAGRRADLQLVRGGDRVPDDGDPADDRDPRPSPASGANAPV